MMDLGGFTSGLMSNLTAQLNPMNQVAVDYAKASTTAIMKEVAAKDQAIIDRWRQLKAEELKKPEPERDDVFIRICNQRMEALG